MQPYFQGKNKDSRSFGGKDRPRQPPLPSSPSDEVLSGPDPGLYLQLHPRPLALTLDFLRLGGKLLPSLLVPQTTQFRILVAREESWPSLLAVSSVKQRLTVPTSLTGLL